MKNWIPRRPLVSLIVLFALSTACAQGLSFGVSLNPIDLVANASVTVPLFTTGQAQHAARAEVSYGFSGLPGVSATYLLRDATPDRLQTYLGAGAGVAFLNTTSIQPLLSVHVLAGANYRITGGLGAYGEVIAGGNGLATKLQFALGIDYTLGGDN